MILRRFVFLNILIFSSDGINKTGNDEFGQNYNIRKLLQNQELDKEELGQAIQEICSQTDMYNDGCNNCLCPLGACTKKWCTAYDENKCESSKKYESGSKTCVCVPGVPPMCYTPSLNQNGQSDSYDQYPGNGRSSNSKSNWPVLYQKLQKDDVIETIGQICRETDTYNDGCNECQCNFNGILSYCPGHWCSAYEDKKCESNSKYQEGSKKCVCLAEIPPMCYTHKGGLDEPGVLPRSFQASRRNHGGGEHGGYPEDYQQSTKRSEEGGETGGYSEDYQQSTERNEEGGETGDYPEEYHQSTERNEGGGEPGGYPEEYHQSTERNKGGGEPGGYPEDYQQSTERNEGPGGNGDYPYNYQQSTGINKEPAETGDYQQNYQSSRIIDEYDDNQQVTSSGRINRDELSKAIIEICKETDMYNDGCNDCQCSDNLGVGICTRKWCSSYDTERCKSSSKYSDGRNRKCVCVTGVSPLCYLPTPNIYKGGDINSYRIAIPSDKSKKDPRKKSGRRMKAQG